METPEDSIHQRIALLVDTKEKGNKSSFARSIGSASGVVSDILGGRKNKPSFDILQKRQLAGKDAIIEDKDALIAAKEEMLVLRGSRDRPN